MAEIEIWYEGDLSTRCVHKENGSEITTDAPKDNQGLGRVFSPTDLLAAALGSCVLTLMGIIARKRNIDIKGTKLTVVKEMQSAPFRRIGRLSVQVYCPYTFSPEITDQLIKAAQTCPVKHSLHPDIQQELIFHWGQS
ncbi:MAG: OsmC family protein [Verrucomicrobia bacterium]|nr:OsmC family protein [Verrucomicrobiota bacterium]